MSNGFLTRNLQPTLDQHLASMANVEALLDAVRHELASHADLLCLTDGSVPGQALAKDFPFPGAVRAIVKRTTRGPANTGAASGLIYDDDANRLGGTIINKSATGLTLYLSDSARPGVGTIYLTPNGSWDFKLGNVLWCGNVFAVADSGVITIAGAVL